MKSIVTYSASALQNGNSGGILKADSSGYYRYILGGFNLSNRSGIEYPLTQKVRDLFEKDSIFKRRMDEGACKGEYDHPNIDGLTKAKAIKRLSIINPDRISHHIKSVELIAKNDEHGKPVVLVYGKVKPAGPKKDILLESMENPEENVAFSVRSFVKQTVRNGRLVRNMSSLLTYDHVVEQGIKQANKFDTIALEALGTEFMITPDIITKAIDSIESENGLESTAETLTMIKDSLGWNRVIVQNLSAFNW